MGNSYKTNPEYRKRQLTKQSQARRDRKLKAIHYKHNECFDCKLAFHPAVYEFHHLNPNEKDVNLAHFKSASWERFVVELDKCIMLCANCHRIRHWSAYETK